MPLYVYVVAMTDKTQGCGGSGRIPDPKQNPFEAGGHHVRDVVCPGCPDCRLDEWRVNVPPKQKCGTCGGKGWYVGELNRQIDCPEGCTPKPPDLSQPPSPAERRKAYKQIHGKRGESCSPP